MLLLLLWIFASKSDSHMWLSWFVHHRISDSAGDLSYPTSLHYHMRQLKHKYIHPLISRRFPKTALKRSAQCSRTKQHFFSAKKKIHISIRFCLQNIHQINFLTFPLTIQIKVTAIHVTSQSSNLEEHHYSSEMDKVALNNSTNNLARRNFWNTKAELWIDVNRITLQ